MWETHMKYIKIKGTDLTVSNIVMGCMRIDSLSPQELERHVRTAMDAGINYFDHADIYGGGACETLFSGVLSASPWLRDQMVIQSKCSIRDGFYDFSKKYLLEAVDGSLSRLGTDHLDILLLHRPDVLMEPEEVAEAFDAMHQSGKVRYFGVSNQNPMQISLLQRYVGQKLILNQVQLSVVHTPIVDSGIAVNTQLPQGVDRAGGLLEYSRLQDMMIQAWSPFQKGTFGGPFLGDMENYPELNHVLNRLAEQYGVTATAIAAAWILRLPADTSVVLGTVSRQHLLEGCAGSDVTLSREAWYELYRAAGNTLP